MESDYKVVRELLPKEGALFKLSQQGGDVYYDENGRWVEKLHPATPEHVDPRHPGPYEWWKSKKPVRPELVAPVRDLHPELPIPQFDKGDILRVNLGRRGFLIVVVDHIDASGIYGWQSSTQGSITTRRDPVAVARERAVDLFVAHEIYHSPEYAPVLIAPLERITFIQAIGDAWAEAREVSGTPTNLPGGSGTYYAPVPATNPIVNTALHRHKYLFFWYTNLEKYWRTKGHRFTYRRAEPLYVFIHPNTHNELLLTLDKSRRYFRSFYVPNMEQIKLGAVYAFHPGKMLKKVNRTLTKMDKRYKSKYDDESSRSAAKAKDVTYVGLSGYREHLEAIQVKADELKKLLSKKPS